MKTLILSIIISTLSISPILALSGYEVMKQVRDQSRIHKTQENLVIMEIKDKKGRARTRDFISRKKLTNDTTNTLIKFYKPKNVKGTSFLTIAKDGNEQTTQFIYLPAFKTIKQLSKSDGNNSFMGSDFTYSDISGRNLDQDTHTLVKEDANYYYIKSIPKDKEDAYSKLNIIVAKDKMVPKQIVFYNKKEQKLKTLANIEIPKIKGMNIIKKSLMKNHLTGAQTLIDAKETKLGIKIHDNAVSVKGMKTI